MSLKILVAGSAGYINSHMAKALSAAGYTSVTYDNMLHCQRRLVRFEPLVEGDLHDRSRFERAMGLTVAVVERARHPEDPARPVVDTTRARMHLGFRPRHTEMNENVSTACAWHEKVGKGGNA